MLENTIISVPSTESVNKKGLLSFHDWHAKIKPFTGYRKEDYKISTVDSVLFFSFLIHSFLRVNFTKVI